MDSYRWLPRGLAAYYSDMDLPVQDPIPWSSPEAPVTASRVALVTTAGVHLRSDAAFDLDRERKEPTWGDPSYRVLPRDVTGEDVAFSHLHYDSSDAQSDLDVLFPVPLLRKLEGEGRVGTVADHHYSFMGFQLDPSELLDRHLPEVISRLKDEAVDAVILTPA